MVFACSQGGRGLRKGSRLYNYIYKGDAVMTVYAPDDTGMMLFFVLIGIVIPGIVMWFDDGSFRKK